MRVQKKALLRFIREKGLTTFPEIELFFRTKGFDYRGGTSIRLQDDTVLWFGWTHRAMRQFMELYNDGKIFSISQKMRLHRRPFLGRKAPRQFLRLLAQSKGCDFVWQSFKTISF